MRFSQGDDAPLSFAHHVPEAALARLGIPLGRTRDDRAVQRAIIGQALVRHDGGGGRISYSRSGEWWRQDRYEDTPFGRARVLGTVDTLTKMGLLNGFRAKRGAHLAEEKADRLQSAFWATESLVQAMSGEAVEHRRPRVPVLLRDENGDPVALPKTQKVQRIIRTMERRNEERAGIHVSVDPKAVAQGRWRFSNHHWWALTDAGEWTCVRGEEHPYMVQMFARRSFDLHGRMYGFWTGLPGVRRSELLLNGEPVCEEEPDWSCLHLDLAYAMCGLRLDGDAYEVPGATGVTRRQLKGAVNTYLNAPTGTATARSLMQKRFERGKDGKRVWPLSMTWDRTKAVLARIEERHEGIKHMFGSDMGVRLMRIDCEMAGEVMDECAKASIPCLPVHDSFSVPAQHKGFVEGVMGEVLDRTRDRLSGSGSTVYPVARLHCAGAAAGAPGAELPGASSVEPRELGVVEVTVPSGEAPTVSPVSTPSLAPAPCQDEPWTSLAVSYPYPRIPTRTRAPAVLAVPWPSLDVSTDPRTRTSEPVPLVSSRAGRTAPSTFSTSPDPRPPSTAIPDRLCPTLRLDMTTCQPAVVTVPDPHPHVIYDVDGTPVRGMPVMLRPIAEDFIAQGHDPYAPPGARPPKVAPGLPSGIVPSAPWPYHRDTR
ncbi:hypothetical protein [Methylobacterium platani]|uniref:Uncharacterized protein n=2 Tax=Methylobacterium platani TaxID=427683 RepID=A0A179SB72_9HYPH|nr:hypothetical protein [Methylobacterium platani]KMO15991.1 hypothetical protein SQ03_15555 [Methylobacterium platani JCM 14648]OAS24878.1 hypothetical protein A5481_12360 [Methylobacterium platani]